MTTTEAIEDDQDLRATPVGFVELELGLPLYEWQDDALSPLECLVDAPETAINPTDRPAVRRVQISVAAPNGSGKSERIVAGAILYWLTVHPRGKVVFTTRDGKQLATQVWPALIAHKSKFPPSWDWVTSPRHRITTPTGGFALLFTTNDEGRAEGFHMDFDPWAQKYDGPLLIVIDEAKSVPDQIFQATDRCGYNARLIISSPGQKVGAFYESQTKHKDAPYICVKAGLTDCPHIPKSKIDDIIQKYGIDDPYTRSVLFGEFMDSTMRGRFSRDGIRYIRQQAITHRQRRRFARLDPQPGGDERAVALQYCREDDPTGWLIVWEEPVPGRRYLVTVDTASFKEQQNGENDARDCHAVLVMRDAYKDEHGRIHPPAVVARIVPPCRWSLEIISQRVAYLSRWLGNALVVVEANNTGIALLVMLKALRVPLYQRATGSRESTVLKPGFHTSKETRPLIIARLATAIAYRATDSEDPLDQGKDADLDIWDDHIADELSYFAYLPDGSEAAEPGLHDDDVMALAIGLHCLPSGTVYRNAVTQQHTHIQRFSAES